MSEITSVKRAIDILNLYSAEDAEFGPTEVSQKLGINKASVIRLLSTLVSTKLLRKTENGRKYCLNGKIMDLAWAYLANANLKDVAKPYLEELRNKTNETTSIHIREGDERVCLATLDGYERIRLGCTIGEHCPLHAGSSGKILLAALSDAEIDEFIKRTGLPGYTDITITDKKALKKDLELVRKEGISISRGEHAEYSFGVSAPIRNYKGDVTASLGITGLIMRFTPEKEVEFTNLVRDTARLISLELGYWR